MKKIAFISDIHGNILALQAVLDDIHSQGCDQIYNLGDTINGMNPGACLALLRDHNHVVSIRGNAEQYVLTPDLDEFPHREESAYTEMIQLIQWWQARLSPADFAFIRKLPSSLYIQDWCLVHESPLERIAIAEADLGDLDEKYREITFHGVGIPKDVTVEALTPTFRFMREKGVFSLFVGHTHVPYVRDVDGRLICNPGSVGLPLDGDPRPSWILCEEREGRQTFEIRRVPYDIDRAIRMFRGSGYQEEQGSHRRDAYIEMMKTGVHWHFYV